MSTRNRLLSTFLLLTLAGCAATEAADSLVVPRQQVRVQQLVSQERGTVLTLHGVTRAVDHARIGFPTGGRLIERAVGIGDRVERGQRLGRLDAGAWDHQLEAQRASLAELDERLAQAQREIHRLQPLAERGSVPLAQLERAQADRDAAVAARRALEAQLDEGRRQRADAELRAPFAGVVVAVHAEPGEMLGAGQPVVELAGAAIEVQVEVPEHVWVQLDLRSPVTVTLPALDVQVQGDIVELAEAGNRQGLFPVVIRIPGGEKRVAGLTARVSLQLPTQRAMIAPLGSIVDPIGAGPSVFVVQEGRADRVPVTVGSLTQEGVVVEGLPDGVAVVVRGQSQLISGQAVEVSRD